MARIFRPFTPYRSPLRAVYAIANTKSGEVYIGSTNNIYNRWKKHWRNFHLGIHGRKLQDSWDKYGAEAFEWMILEVVSSKYDLAEREQFWIDATDNKLLNHSPSATSNLGIKQFPETGRKISAKLRGRPKSQEHIRKQKEIQRARVLKQKPGYVDKIREEYSGEKGEQVRLAQKYGISKNDVSRIVRGTRWQSQEYTGKRCYKSSTG